MAAVAASLAVGGRHAMSWRGAYAGAAVFALTVAHGHASEVGADAWQLPAAYGLVLAALLWDSAWNRFQTAMLFVPAVASLGAGAAIWWQGWPSLHMAWTPLAFASGWPRLKLVAGGRDLRKAPGQREWRSASPRPRDRYDGDPGTGGGFAWLPRMELSASVARRNWGIFGGDRRSEAPNASHCRAPSVALARSPSSFALEVRSLRPPWRLPVRAWPVDAICLRADSRWKGTRPRAVSGIRWPS